jgi:hypothetical protein
LHTFLAPCESNARRDETLDTCLLDRFRVLLVSEAHAPALRLIFPTDVALVRRRNDIVRAQRRQLEVAAAERRLQVRVEQEFYTPRGIPAIQLVRVSTGPR